NDLASSFWRIEHIDGVLCGVFHIGKITGLLSVTKDFDRLPTHHTLDNYRNDPCVAPGILPRTIVIEWSNNSGINPESLHIRLDNGIFSSFTGRIGSNG